MRLKIILLVVAAMLVAAVATSRSVSLQGQTETKKKWEDPTTLQARVKRVKAKGFPKATFPAPIMEYADNIDLKTALSQNTLVVADVIDKVSRMLDSHTIGTFYRLKIVETVSRPEAPVCCDPKDEEFPSDLPALNENEMYLAGIGGTVQIDGVEVTVTEDFEDLLPYARYMLFLSPSASGKISLAKVGPRGVFRIKANTHLESIVGKPSKLEREIEQTYGNSLTRLKDDVKRQRGLSQ